MQECWYALALALVSVNHNTPEMAFQSLDKGIVSKHNKTLTDADFEDMLTMRKDKVKFKDLADIYGVEVTCLFKRIKEFQKNKIKGRKSK